MRFQKPGSIVAVTWADAYSEDDWGPVEERLLQHDVPVVTITVGIVLKHTADGITVARSYQEQDHTTEGSFNIPAGMIKDIEKWPKRALVGVKVV